jgi:paraquat-inducible protein B
LIEVPGVLTTTDELRLTAEEFARKLRALPLDQIFADISETLRDIRKLVGSEDTKKSTAALAKALEGVDKTISTLNQNLGPILKSTDKTMQQAHALAEESRALVTDSRNLVNDVHREVGPVLANADKTLSAATAALNKAQSAVTTVEDSVGPDSSLNQTLIALKDAARSLKDLTDFLERHPESVISGKKQ